MVSSDIFMINKKILLCIIDYYSQFPIVKKVGSLGADDLVQMAKIMLAKYQFP